LSGARKFRHITAERKKKGALILRIGMMIDLGTNGRFVIPKEYRKFYHLGEDGPVCLIETEEGILLTNPRYKVVLIEGTEEENSTEC